MTEEEMEAAAIAAANNFGPAEQMWIPDPDTGVYVFVDMKKPSDEALVVLQKIYGKRNG